MSMQERGILFILSGPSGAGKGTVCKALMERLPDICLSVSVTTRVPRDGEQHGVNYFFKTRAQFDEMAAQGDLLEWAEVYGNCYGTPRPFVEQKLDEGHDVLLEIDIQGAMQVKKTYPQGVFIFLIPPSAMELEARILGRGSETEASFRKRFGAAREELEMMEHYHYVVVNDVVEAACERILSIITAEHCSVPRNLFLLEEW